MRLVPVLFVALALGLAGCGGSGSQGPSAQQAPLTVNDWKALPVDQKYSSETLERLKTGDPGLQTAEGWETFQKNVVGPARRKDFPNGKALR
jgi:hypothetical protein